MLFHLKNKKYWSLLFMACTLLLAIFAYQPQVMAVDAGILTVDLSAKASSQEGDTPTAKVQSSVEAALAQSLVPSQGPVQVGEYEPANVHVRYDDSSTWRHVIRYADAAYIKLHFAALELAPGDALLISDASGAQVHTYPGSGVTTDGKAGFWALSVVGDTAIVELRRNAVAAPYENSDYYQAALGGTPTSDLTIFIDQYARGYPEGFIDSMPSLSSTCGALDRTDVACYETAYPTEFDKANAVARILVNGSSHCTGWRVTHENFLFTNEHCITSQAQLDQMEFWFDYQRPLCETGGTNTPVIVTGDTFLIDDSTLDFALVTLDNFASIESFGYMELDPRVPNLGEEIYIPQHGAGNPKEFGIDSDVNLPNMLCQVDMPVADGIGTGTDVGYMCDTIGGSSGSPVLSRDTHKVIALHHFGNSAAPNCSASSSSSLNRGVRIDLILPMVESFLPEPLTSFTVEATPETLAVCVPDYADYQVVAGTTSNFATAVTLAAVNVPAGATATFDVNGMTPTFTSTMTISNTGGVTAGEYDIHVVGSSPTTTVTTTVGLLVNGAAPTVPTLTSPADGAVNQSTVPSFLWEAIDGATEYVIEIASDAGFTTIVDSATVSTNGYTSGVVLNSDATYYWRVRAVNACGVGADSLIYSFTTQSASLLCNGAMVEFETGIPADWALNDNGGNFGWTVTGAPDCSAPNWSGGNETPGSGLAACADADGNNNPPSPYDAEMWTNTFSLVGQSAVTLTYAAAYNELNGSLFDVDITTDNGSSWTNLLSWADDHSGGEFVNLDLSAYADESDVRVRYRFHGTGWDWWAEVDEVQLSCVGSGAAASIAPMSSVISAPVMSTAVHTFTVTNDGSTNEVFELAVSGNSWPTQLNMSDTGNLMPGQEAEVEVHVSVPVTAVMSSDSYTITASISDTHYAYATGETTGYNPDNDGVGASVEDAAPNGGDGNNDGIPDSVQPDVASFPNGHDGGYMTLEANGTLTEVSAEAAPSTLPADVLAYTHGVLNFSVGVEISGTAWVTVTMHTAGSHTPNSLWKQNNVGDWWLFDWHSDSGTGAMVHDAQTVVLHLQDGGRGDWDESANGVIVDPSAVAFSLLNKAYMPMLMTP